MFLGPKDGFGGGAGLASSFGFAGSLALTPGPLPASGYAFLIALNDSATYVRTRGLETGAVYHDLIGKVA